MKFASNSNWDIIQDPLFNYKMRSQMEGLTKISKSSYPENNYLNLKFGKIGLNVTVYEDSIFVRQGYREWVLNCLSELIYLSSTPFYHILKEALGVISSTGFFDNSPFLKISV